MAGRYKSPLQWSDVTPKAVWMNRRQLMAGVAAGAGLAGDARGRGGRGPRAQQLRGHHELQQLLRIRDRQGGPQALRAGADDRPVVHRDRRDGGPAGDLRSCRRAGRPGDRGAHLPLPLRRGMVDGDPVERVRAGRPAEPRGRAAVGEVRGLRDAGAAGGDAGRALSGHRVALSRGAAARRGDASADDPCHRSLWRGRCPSRTARRSGSWSRGSTGSSRSSRSCGSR